MKIAFKNLSFLTLSIGLLVGIIAGLTACYQIDVPSLRSDLLASVNANNNNNYNNDDDDDDDDDRRRLTCEDRDSCQDICDAMFGSLVSRRNCYEESNRDVDILQEVFDVIADSSITKRELESLDADDFGFFLSMNNGTDDFVDIIKRKYDSNEAKIALEWIARSEDIASEISAYDSDYQVLYNLMKIRAGNHNQINAHGGNTFPKLTSSGFEINNNRFLSLDIDLVSFATGFTGRNNSGYGSGDDESFIEYAGSKNDVSYELAHSTLASVCKDAVNEDDIDDDDVKRCMLATYCLFGDNNWPNFLDDNPFNISDDRDEACISETLNDKDSVDNYF